jgi:hypothetical protein
MLKSQRPLAGARPRTGSRICSHLPGRDRERAQAPPGAARITVESRSAAFGGDHLRVSSKAFAQQSFQQPARVTRLTANV